MTQKPRKEKPAPRPAPRQDESAGALYVHVPFCARKCRYCDFYSLAATAPAAEEYVRAVTAELRLRLDELAVPLGSAFVGGGTPTVLGAALLGDLLGAIAPLTDARTEFSVETNPHTTDAAVADAMAAAGVSRVSLGAQSFDAGALSPLGRLHGPEEIAPAVAAIRAAGIANVSLDLIYGVPGQSAASWRETLDRAIALAPAHVSCYALSVEEGTPLAADRDAGLLAEADDEQHRACYDAAVDALTAAGFEHYEISNFARPGLRCRHNLTYWGNGAYVGLGPAAASCVGGVRRTHAPDVDAYCRAIREGTPAPATEERLTGRARMAETLMLALRLTGGVSRRGFAERFGADPLEAFAGSFSRAIAAGAIVHAGDILRFSRDYLFVADSVLADILAEA